MTPPPPELVDAALAAPADPVPRLAIADWLDEAGDADGAALARVQARLEQEHARPLPPGEIAALSAEERRLVALNGVAWSRWLGETAGFTEAEVTFAWGVPRGVRVQGKPRPGGEAALDALPLLESFEHPGRVALPRAWVAALGRLRALRVLVARLDGGSVTAADIAPLAGCPLLTTLVLYAGNNREVQPAEWRATLRAAAFDRAATLPERERETLARQVFAGGLVALPDGRAHLEAEAEPAACTALVAAVPRVTFASLRLLDERPPTPGLAQQRDLRGLALTLRHLREGDLLGLSHLRELSLSVLADDADGRALAAVLSEQPELRALHLSGRFTQRRTVVNAITACRNLRYLRLGLAGLTDADFARLELPRLTDLMLFGSDYVPSTLARLPALQALGPGQHTDWPILAGRLARPDVLICHPSAPAPPTAWLGGRWGGSLSRPERLGDAQLRVPAWLERADAGDPSRAEWREWGEADGGDSTLGPTRVTLEELPFAPAPDQWADVLCGPPTAHGPARWTGVPARVTPSSAECPPRVQAGGSTRWLIARRYLWLGRGRSLRLSVESSQMRMHLWNWLAAPIADSVRLPEAR